MRARLLPSWTATLYWKAAVFITMMCCVVALVLGTLVHVIVTRQTVHQARTTALSKLAAATQSYVAGDPLRRGTGLNPPELPEPLRDLALHGERGTMFGDVDGRRTMWAAGPAGGTALAVQVDYTRSAESIRGLDRAIIISSALAIGGTLLIGIFAVSRVTRRLHRTAAVARRISAGDLDARVADPRTTGPTSSQDEVAAVSAALDVMAASLQRRLQSEQRFTADVAHELRTPLAGLHASAELLPPGRPTELVQDRVQVLRRLTEDLLEISRLDSRTETVELDAHYLGRLAERAVAASGLETEVRIVRDVCLITDRRRLERVLGNLVSNAHRHGRPPVVLTVDGPVITVRDHGDGYPGYLLDHGPQRFRTEPTSNGNKGHGLGLTIAVGQARTISAELRFTNAPDGGAVSTLTLPTPEEGAGPLL
ncbi:HAMP domain-containing sensor histidine kinase [Streptomyces sp. H10-C2]|uniref:sensor histidine kinase n=1 Tax=unclassified Streptomyces TaxID=2593676 RepID=UPI0024B8C1FD|nr:MULTISPECIES: HAMP domain-containing sensor histidine kinase [unclassified Streptomyces]MDJ0341215.1 HAMP domain-containing sensor histidine kinase [Streptomyces sp. PH10-H1]MDJ0369432.1 HAMP domain-containing sensor histidine kinase [Streptomyces sp. H10-C2]